MENTLYSYHVYGKLQSVLLSFSWKYLHSTPAKETIFGPLWNFTTARNIYVDPFERQQIFPLPRYMLPGSSA